MTNCEIKQGISKCTEKPPKCNGFICLNPLCQLETSAFGHNLFHVATATALVNADFCPVQSLSAQNSSGHRDKCC